MSPSLFLLLASCPLPPPKSHHHYLHHLFSRTFSIHHPSDYPDQIIFAYMSLSTKVQGGPIPSTQSIPQTAFLKVQSFHSACFNVTRMWSDAPVSFVSKFVPENAFCLQVLCFPLHSLYLSFFPNPPTIFSFLLPFLSACMSLCISFILVLFNHSGPVFILFLSLCVCLPVSFSCLPLPSVGLM